MRGKEALFGSIRRGRIFFVDHVPLPNLKITNLLIQQGVPVGEKPHRPRFKEDDDFILGHLFSDKLEHRLRVLGVGSIAARAPAREIPGKEPKGLCGQKQ